MTIASILDHVKHGILLFYFPVSHYFSLQLKKIFKKSQDSVLSNFLRPTTARRIFILTLFSVFGNVIKQYFKFFDILHLFFVFSTRSPKIMFSHGAAIIKDRERENKNR